MIVLSRILLKTSTKITNVPLSLHCYFMKALLSNISEFFENKLLFLKDKILLFGTQSHVIFMFCDTENNINLIG